MDKGWRDLSGCSSQAIKSTSSASGEALQLEASLDFKKNGSHVVHAVVFFQL
jgi:hypothetical protein